jgi:thiol-disulfide isomerase/thioredoxin
LRVAHLLVLVAAAAAGCARGVPAPSPSSTSQPLTLKLPLYPSGAMHDLAEDRGHVVLLDVWATWCEPCKHALPLYQELQGKYGSQGFRVYTINIDEDGRQIPAFVKELNLQLPILLDTGARVAEDQLHVQAMPTTVLLDRAGLIRFRHDGFNPLATSRYESEVQTLLAESAK